MRNLIFLMFLILNGCSSAPTFVGESFSYKFTESEGQAIVYLYRPEKKLSSCCWPAISISNNPKISLPNGSYQLVKVAPGRYYVSFKYMRGSLDKPKTASKEFNKGIFLELESGKEYFLRFDVVSMREIANVQEARPTFTSEFQIGDLRLRQVPKEIAISEMEGTRKVDY